MWRADRHKPAGDAITRRLTPVGSPNFFRLLSAASTRRISLEHHAIRQPHDWRRTAMRFGVSAIGLLLLAGFAAVGGAGDKKDNVPPEGFIALFNGKDLTNWQGAIDVRQRAKLDGEALEAAQKKRDEQVLPHWTVKDGVLINDGKGGNLATIKDYTDFELLVDWKIEPAGDSGIYLRGVPQVQIWDSATLKGGLAADKDKGSGGLWNNPKGSKGKDPIKNADKAPGEWNHFRIIMKGENVTVYLNGELVVEEAPLTAFNPLPKKGAIELQQHPKQDGTHGNIEFKNIYIKEL
jgi:hypothetical protein